MASTKFFLDFAAKKKTTADIRCVQMLVHNALVGGRLRALCHYNELIFKRSDTFYYKK